uniref:Uncharacterized protein n=1 Tax=Rhipicephalus appendiculatus TaxID=34631 RepID=A0A131YAZ3_RHIAP
MVNSTGRTGASFLALPPRICIPLVDSEQVRVFHWQIRSTHSTMERSALLRLSEADFAGTPARQCRHFRYSRATQLSSVFFEAVSDHPVHLFTFLKRRRLILLDELRVCFLEVPGPVYVEYA